MSKQKKKERIAQQASGLFKISEITDEHIRFSDGSMITFDHCADCCEWNYADFEQLDDLARNALFDTANLAFRAVDGSGFCFGNKDGRMYFVPCYSSQNGWYSLDIQIYYYYAKLQFTKEVLSFNAEEVEEQVSLLGNLHKKSITTLCKLPLDKINFIYYNIDTNKRKDLIL